MNKLNRYRRYGVVAGALFLLLVTAGTHSYVVTRQYAALAGQRVMAMQPRSSAVAGGEAMPPVRAPGGSILLTQPPSALVDLTGMSRSLLSGRFIDEAAAARRPFAVVIGNTSDALPQSGISQADIIYEVVAEGAATRLIGIFQDFDTARIGSVRSARDYFVDIALGYDAFFVHFGGSPQFYQALRNHRVDNIDGIRLDGGVRTSNFEAVVFWRDEARWRVARTREHSAFTGANNLLGRIERAGYREYRREDWSSPFTFFDERRSPEGSTPAEHISVSFVSNVPSVFIFDPESGRYRRYQNRVAHIDEESGYQLMADNVLVQLTNVRAIPGDGAGRRDVDIVGSGRGYLFTNGTMTPVTWSKPNVNAPTEWRFENGDKITLNMGTTWICVTNREPVVETALAVNE